MVMEKPGLRLRTLGELRLDGGDGDAIAARRRELVVLAYLLRRAPQPVPRVELATVFWGDRADRRARHSLRQALSQLRRLVGDGLIVDADSVAASADAVAWDVTELETLLSAGELEQAVDRWAGEFLPEAEDRAPEGLCGWVRAEREGLRRRLEHALRRLVAAAESHGDWAQAIRWAERWIELCPVDEEPYRRCIEALTLSRRTDEALARHARFLVVRADEFGDAPSAAFMQLGERLRQERTDEASARLGRGGSFAAPPLLGRDDAFSTLVGAWSAACAGRGQLVVVGADEGLGKTRLCDEFLRWTAERGGDSFVLQARVFAAQDPPDWTTARELLADLPAAPGLAAAAVSTLATLATLVPALREQYPGLPGGRDDETGIRDAVDQVIDDVAFEVPVVLVVDHFPRADAASRRLIRSLAAACAARRVLIVVTARTEEAAAAPELTDLPGAVEVRSIRLRPLDLAAVEAMLAPALAAGAEPRHRLARLLHGESGGNPRYVLQLLDALIQDERIVREPGGAWRLQPGTLGSPLPLPRELREATRLRLDRLGADARRALAAAAASDASHSRGWQPGRAEPGHGLEPARLTAALGELVAAGFIEPGPDGGFGFRVPLVRRAVAALLPAVRPAAPRAAPQPGRWSRARIGTRGVAAAAACLLLLIAGVHHLLRAERTQPPSVSASRIAVFPFSVSGGGAFDYLADGMADLLSVNLSGAGELRTVNRHSLLSFLQDQPSVRLDAEQAAEIAGRFGAGMFVVGSVLGTGDRLRIVAELHEPSRGPDPVSRASVEGSADQLLELVDRLTGRLLANWNEEAGSRMAGLAARTTASLPALKAYLSGEHEFRHGRFAPAVAAFRQAIDADSTFGLAHFRLSVAAEWAMQYDQARAATQLAVRHGSRLPDRERLLLQATLAMNRGAAREAEDLVRSILAVDADDSEAWSQLGEILFHYGPRSGRSLDPARTAFEHTVRFEPRHLNALVHLARIAAYRQEAAGLDSLAQRVLELSVDGDPAWEMRALRAAATGMPRARLLAELDGAEPERVVIAAWSLAVYGRDLEGALAVAETLTGTTYPQAWASIGWVLVAQLETARGRPAAAARALRELERLDAGAAVKYRALLSVLPDMPTTADELRRIHGELTAWADDERSPRRPAHGFFAIHTGLNPHLREFLLGVVDARLGRLEHAHRRADRLLELPVRSSEDHSLVNDLTRTVRGEATLAAGDAAQAAGILAGDADVWYQRAMVSPFYSRAYQRFLRAGALAELGHDAQALRDLDTFSAQAVHDLVYLAPSHLRRADINERLGRPDRARHHLARFVELWADAEPALQPLVRSARQRLEAL